MEPDSNLFGPLDHKLCDKCGLYYNPKIPHQCFPQAKELNEQRQKLKAWLGRGVKTVD